MNIFKEIFTNHIYDEINNLVRWNGLSRVKDETVGHHTHIVTFFSRVIYEAIFSKSELSQTDKDRDIAEILTYSVFHDFDEAFTGDIIHGFKHNAFNGNKVKENIEDFLNSVEAIQFSEDNPLHNLMREYAFKKQYALPFYKELVKLSDWLSMLFYIKKEINLGNKNLTNKVIYCTDAVNVQTKHLSMSIGISYPKLKGLDFKILEDIQTTNFYE